MKTSRRRARHTPCASAVLLALACALPTARAQAPAAGDGAWQGCARLADAAARLACFDAWATAQGRAPAAVAAPPVPASTLAAPTPAPTAPLPAGAPVVATVDGARAPDPDEGCRDPRHSELSRYWELEPASGCGVFGIRSYRPMSLSLIASDSVNKQPLSGNPVNTATTAQPYRNTETRIQLSVRTKLAEGLLTGGGPRRDSLWFGYTQQSYWQLFTPGVSRPFRNTDHEPELIYVYPLASRPVAGWNLRYAGAGLVHQSNGQSLPLSRSWNRAYLMAGIEHRDGFSLRGRVWKRLQESAETDDNPGISDYVGRAELAGAWSRTGGQGMALTVRHSLRSAGRGSARLEWFVPVGSDDLPGEPAKLRFHTQLFTGYGDSLVDYNRKRTVLSVGLSLVDW